MRREIAMSRATFHAGILSFGMSLIATSVFGETISFVVPGTSDPWLAGMPPGSIASVTDFAPGQSPEQVAGLIPQTTLTFSASGLVSNGSCGPVNCPTSSPDGGETPGKPFFTHDLTGAENGISDAMIPLNALVGVFLGSDQPNLTPPPSPLDFSTPTSRDYLLLKPGLKQVFFIGDGLTSASEVQQIVIPDGATRLFLGTMDGCCNADNVGSFAVQATGQGIFFIPKTFIPEPSTSILVSIASLRMTGGFSRGRKRA
jgi:hypothetical protein